ncbi:MAG TPA: FHA domain-containing protein [Myxococcaceae bacterium]|nr:FHA domain-containing protein [Myxococcaceae bacterium]
MPAALSAYARELLNSDQEARKSLDYPVLICEEPGIGFEDEFFTTETTPKKKQGSGSPLVFEVKKSPNKTNAFAMGITVGRTGNNDVVLEDNSVSRFHAYFQKDLKTGLWTLMDAESKNGSWIDALRLTSGKSALVSDGCHLRFGEVELLFLLPESLLDYLEGKLTG